MRTKSLLLFCVVAFAISLQAQQLTMHIGRTQSVFNYQDSQGQENLLFNPETNFNYMLGYRKDLAKQVHLTARLSFTQMSNSATDLYYVNAFSWNINYLRLGLGIELEWLKTRNLAVYGRVSVGPQFMLNGTQQINNEKISLKKAEQFNKPLVAAGPGIGLNYCLAKDVAITLDYVFHRNFRLGKDPSNEQLTINNHQVSLGLLWSLKKCKYCQPKRYK